MPKTVAFVTCTYGRPHVSAIYRDELLKLQSKFSDYKFINVVVDSDLSNNGVFGKEFIYKNYRNMPLSNKWNFALGQLRGRKFDYVIFMGSDDIMDEKVLAKLDELMAANDWAGSLDIYFKKFGGSKVVHWNGYVGKREGEPIGAGRAISRKIIEENGYRLWDNGLKKGLDSSMYKRLGKYKRGTFRCSDIGGVLMDIKSEINICKLKHYKL